MNRDFFNVSRAFGRPQYITTNVVFVRVEKTQGEDVRGMRAIGDTGVALGVHDGMGGVKGVFGTIGGAFPSVEFSSAIDGEAVLV